MVVCDSPLGPPIVGWAPDPTLLHNQPGSHMRPVTQQRKCGHVYYTRDDSEEFLNAAAESMSPEEVMREIDSNELYGTSTAVRAWQRLAATDALPPRLQLVRLTVDWSRRWDTVTISLRAQEHLCQAWRASSRGDSYRATDPKSHTIRGFPSLLIDTAAEAYGEPIPPLPQPSLIEYARKRVTVPGQTMLVVAPAQRDLALNSRGKYHVYKAWDSDPLGLKACNAVPVVPVEKYTTNCRIIADAIRASRR